MTSLMTVMEDYFVYKNFKYLRLDGGTKAEERGDMLRIFNAKDADYFIFLLSTRAGGLGLNLQCADTVIIFDSDWNPHQDLQAQDRAHRIGQKNEVRVLRLMTVNSVEEKILAAARYKLNVDEKVIQAGKFDAKSTGQERREMLQNILKQDTQSIEDDPEVPDDETVNQMVARTEEEYELFQRMDIERRRLEARDANRKPRLMEESELPGWLLKDDTQLEKMRIEAEENDLYGRGTRARKEVDYSDSLTEREFLNAVEEGNLDEVSEKKRQRRAQKATKRRADDSMNDGDQNDESLDNTMSNNDVSVTGNGGGGGGNGSQSGVVKRKRGRPSAAASTSGRKGSMNTMSDKRYARLLKKMQFLIKLLMNYKDSDGRVLSEPFYQLPTRRDLPDYYDIIKKPIDLKRIQQRIKENKYQSLDQLELDIELMCRNTQEYNVEGSLIYEDSVVLQLVFKKARSRLDSENNESDQEDENEDEDVDVNNDDDYDQDSSLNKSSKNKRPRVEKSEKKGKPGRKKKSTNDDDDDDIDDDEDEEVDDDYGTAPYKVKTHDADYVASKTSHKPRVDKKPAAVCVESESVVNKADNIEEGELGEEDDSSKSKNNDTNSITNNNSDVSTLKKSKDKQNVNSATADDDMYDEEDDTANDDADFDENDAEDNELNCKNNVNKNILGEANQQNGSQSEFKPVTNENNRSCTKT
jgi:SWI/SNF-related matrix-associated actin-dependent regulator of chromatin subfamily A protein 2/4